MKLIYKNYTIEDDRNCFILRETWVIKKGEKKGEEFEEDVLYPTTLVSTFKRMFERECLKKENTFELKEYIEELKAMQEQFIKDIEKLVNSKKTFDKKG